VRRGHILANAADAVDPPAKDDSVPRNAWAAEEVRRFLEVAGEDRFAAVWRLVLPSGMRRGELCGMRWSDIDGARVTVRRQVLVRPGRAWDEERIYVRETTKSRRVRVVTVDDGTATALRRWKAQQAEERLAFGPAYGDDGWVIAEADGSLVQPDTLSSRWKRLERLAGVRPIGCTAHATPTPSSRSRPALASTS
jgi:integrase